MHDRASIGICLPIDALNTKASEELQMSNMNSSTNLPRRAVLTGLAALSTAAGTVTMEGPMMEDPLEYHLREAAKLLQARNPAFPVWDIEHFKGSRGRMQSVTLMAWRA
ncbi:hypothetical protein AJ88_19240 [Mesorhizobium amorphae CCBAU 01583]|nr:hypothetical protein AJ88_19240 [Mesorhizobium amorphae CCBAU 01583]